MNLDKIFSSLVAISLVAGCTKPPEHSPDAIGKLAEDTQKEVLIALNRKQEGIIDKLNALGVGAEIGTGSGCVIELTGKPGKKIRLSTTCNGVTFDKDMKLNEESADYFLTQVINADVVGGQFTDENACITIENPEGTLTTCPPIEQTAPQESDTKNTSI